jgi:heme exporter protein D
MNAIWHDPGAWIAVSVSALFLVMALAMYLAFRKILRARPPEDEREERPKNEP